jgi:hypothetical protein
MRGVVYGLNANGCCHAIMAFLCPIDVLLIIQLFEKSNTFLNFEKKKEF